MTGSSLVCNLFVFLAICFSARNIKKMSALLKLFFNIEDLYKFYNIKEMQILLLASITYPDRVRLYIWLYAGLQDTMLAVLSRVLSWCVCQSYRLLDVFFLSLKKNILFACSGWIVVTCRLSFSASTDEIFKHSVHCVLPSLYIP